MPILEIEIVDQPQKQDIAQPLADAAAAVFKTSAGRTWVKVRFMEPECYAENGVTAGETSPVFVSVLLSRAPSLKLKQEIAQELSSAIGAVLNRPAENVHILFEAEAMGRIAFGGVLRIE